MGIATITIRCGERAGCRLVPCKLRSIVARHEIVIWLLVGLMRLNGREMLLLLILIGHCCVG